jgi:hypothetical protein
MQKDAAPHISIGASSTLPAAVPLDDRGLEGLAPQLCYLEAYFVGADLQRSVAASLSVLRRLAAFITAGATELVCLSIQHRIQRLTTVSRTISPRWSRIRASSIWITRPIGFSSLIGYSFLV